MAISILIYSPLKPIVFVGDSLRRLREFPEDARHDAGYQLDKVQRGQAPDDFKPIASIGKGVEEIRIWDDFRHVPSDLHRAVARRRLCLARVPEEDSGNTEA